jgi:hypothetical protein
MVEEIFELQEARRLMRVFLFTSLILILNLAIGSDYDFGTKVMADDTDMGMPLFDLPGGWTVGFWDTGTPRIRSS